MDIVKMKEVLNRMREHRPTYPKRAIVTAGMPYGNKTLHCGHVGGLFIHADAFARFMRDRIGKENVIFVSGTDCYGSPIMEGYRKLKETTDFAGSIEDYVKYIGKTVDEFKEDIKKGATRNVKARLVLEKLIRVNKLDITEEDIDNKLAEMAKNVGKDVEEYKKQANNDMVNHIANELLMKKLMNFLHETNEIK